MSRSRINSTPSLSRRRHATPHGVGNRLDDAIVSGLLLLRNQLLWWVLLLGGAIVFPQVLVMRDAVQILQYERSIAPVLRND